MAVAAILAAAAAFPGGTQEISSRATGLGNAVTALYDAGDTLRTNPAGLGFLRGSHGFIGIDGGMSVGIVDVEDTESGDVGEGETDSVEDFDFAGRLQFAKQNWGVGLDQTIGYHRDGLYYSDLGLYGGLGIALGPIGIGANLTHVASSVGYYDGSPNEVFNEGTMGEALDAATAGEPQSHTALGVGAMLNFDKLSAGLFLPDLMSAGDSERLGGEGMLDTANLGVAYRPILVRTGNQRTTIFRLLVSADAQNVGSDENRSLHFGTEADINFVIFGVGGRLGYTLPAATANNQSPLISVGASADVLLATIHFGVVFPQVAAEAESETLGDVARFSIAAAVEW